MKRTTKSSLEKRKKVMDAYRARKKAEAEAAAIFNPPPIIPSAMDEIIAGAAMPFQIPPDTLTLPAMGWRCRPYQDAAWKYMTENQGRGKLAVLNWHRRAGKDNFLFNLIAYMTTQRKGMYWHAFPELKQGRKAIWEGFTREGQKTLDYIPQALRQDVNQQELRINLSTGSTYMIVGGADPDSNLGAGPLGIGFSEYSMMNPKMWDLISPMLGENEGWALFISTPRGHNHFYDLYKYAESNPNCFAQTLTVEDTWYYDNNGLKRPVITQDFLNQERAMGKTEDWIRQEYYCDFNASVEGAIYGKLMTDAVNTSRITDVDYDPSLPVYTAWDLGYRDATSIIFYQLPQDESVRIFDYYENSYQLISHYCQVVRNKRYNYACHYAPWDVSNKTLASNGVLSIARENGIHFQKCRRTEVEEGIERVRENFNRFYFDRTRCAKLIDALKAYKRNYDELTKVFTDPVHNFASHPADALRYLCVSLPRQRHLQNIYDQHNNPTVSFQGYGNDPVDEEQHFYILN